MRELLIGCGNRRLKRLHFDDGNWDELVTIDHDPNCGADHVHDLEDLPWPFEDDSFDACHGYEVFEHIGKQGDYRSFFAHFAEIYRILKPGGLLFATVPAWNDIWAWGDPSHTRIISRASLVFLDQQQYHKQVGTNAMTDFRWLWKGDLELVAADDVPEDKPAHLHFALKAHKPARHFGD